MQHLGAGIVLSAVSTELLPEMLDTPKEKGGIYALAILVGFSLGTCVDIMSMRYSCFSTAGGLLTHARTHARGPPPPTGVALMLGVANFCGEPEVEAEDTEGAHHEEEGEAQAGDALPPASLPQEEGEGAEAREAQPPPAAHHLKRRASLMEMYRRASMEDVQGAVAAALAPSSMATGLLGRMLKGSKVPWPLVMAVYVDSFMDGFLIGIASVAGASAGVIMAVSRGRRPHAITPP
jgi:zinc transporter ZupT